MYGLKLQNGFFDFISGQECGAKIISIVTVTIRLGMQSFPHRVPLLNHLTSWMTRITIVLTYFNFISFTQSTHHAYILILCSLLSCSTLFEPILHSRQMSWAFIKWFFTGRPICPMPNFLDALAFKKMHVLESSTLYPWYWFNIFTCSSCIHVSTLCSFSMRYHSLILVSLSICFSTFPPPPPVARNQININLLYIHWKTYILKKVQKSPCKMQTPLNCWLSELIFICFYSPSKSTVDTYISLSQ